MASRSPPKSTTPCNTHTQFMTRVPPEILSLIIVLALSDSHSFSDIASFSLASSSFRSIALSHFLRQIQVSNSAQWKQTFRLLCSYESQMMQSGFGFVRCVCSPAPTLCYIWHPGPCLQILRFCTTTPPGSASSHISEKFPFSLIKKASQHNTAPSNYSASTCAPLAF